MSALCYNIPFASLLLAILSAVAAPLLRSPERALNLVRGVQLAVAALSGLLLAWLWQTGGSFTYTLGHFPAPWGNELLAGPLEALLALCFSLVMFLSMTGGADDLRRDIPEERRGRYCLLMQLLYAALLALTAGLLVLGDIGDALDDHLAGLGIDGQDLALLALDGLIAVLGTGDDDDLVVLFDMNLIHSSILPITALREPAKRSS